MSSVYKALPKALFLQLFAFTMLVFPSTSYGVGGDELLRQCIEAKNSMDEGMTAPGGSLLDIGFCAGFLRGVIDTTNTVSTFYGHEIVCLPSGGISNGQAVRIVVDYLRQNPSMLHQRGADLAISAFAEAFPCI